MMSGLSTSTRLFGIFLFLITGTQITLGQISEEEFGSFEWKPLRSSNVVAIAYKSGEQNLYLHFTRNRFYVFKEVPLATVRGLLKSSSPGGFVHRVLRPHYTFEKLSASKLPPNLAQDLLPDDTEN
jgi:hypothetical protein